MQILVIPRDDLSPDKCRKLGSAIDAVCAADSDLRPEIRDSEQSSVENLRGGRLPDTWYEQAALEEWANYPHVFHTDYEDILEIAREQDIPEGNSRAIGLRISAQFEFHYETACQLFRQFIPKALVADVVFDGEFSWNDL